MWHGDHEHLKGNTGRSGVLRAAAAPLDAEDVLHNRAMVLSQNLDFPISRTGVCCEIGKSSAFQSALSASPALLLGSF